MLSISIRTFIIVLFSVSILSTASLTLGITFSITFQSTSELGLSYAESLAAKSKHDFEEFVTLPMRQLQGLQGRMGAPAGRPKLLPQDMPYVDYESRWKWTEDCHEYMMDTQFESSFAYSFTSLGFEDGAYRGSGNT